MKRYLIPALALGLCCLPAPACAGPVGGHSAGAELLARAEAQPRITMGDAMEMVQRRTGGRILVAQAVRVEGRLMYRIKVLTARGEVRIYFVDAETGAIQ